MISSLPASSRALGALYAGPALALGVLFGGLSSLLIWPWFWLPRGRRERYTMLGCQWFAWMCLRFALFSRIDVVGKEKLPARSGYLVVSNHRSWVDVALLQLYTRSNGVSKKEVAYIPFFGLNGYLTGAVFFDRKSRMGRARVIEDALGLMRAGANVHVFPEGTRTRTGSLAKKVHLRLLQSASENGIPLVPACVWGTEHAVPAEGFYVMPGRSVGIAMGEAVERAEGESHEDHAERAWEAVVALAAKHGADEPFRL